MPSVTLTPAELATLDAMIEALKENESSRAATTPVPLGRLTAPMLTTVVIDATKIVGAGTRIAREDAAVLADLKKRVADLKSTVSLSELVELRGRATATKGPTKA